MQSAKLSQVLPPWDKFVYSQCPCSRRPENDEEKKSLHSVVGKLCGSCSCVLSAHSVQQIGHELLPNFGTMLRTRTTKLLSLNLPSRAHHLEEVTDLG